MSDVQSVDLNELALNYDDKRRMEPQDFERLINCIRHYGKVEGDVLEIGCGSGYYLAPLAQRLPKASFYGMDIADAMLASAKGKLNRQALTNCSLAKGNAHYLPFADNVFDFVLMSQVLHYFENLPLVIAEVHRVAKPKARVLVITSSHLQLKSHLDIALFPGLVKRDMARIPSIERIRHLFESGSFEIMAAVEFASTFRFSSVEALVERVAQKPWSSYQLFSEGEFMRRLMVFKRKLYERFGRGEIAYLFPQTLLFFQKT
jgi:ubiquinone/menaquinone biosynthesis C-methylase UbiE